MEEYGYPRTVTSNLVQEEYDIGGNNVYSTKVKIQIKPEIELSYYFFSTDDYLFKVRLMAYSRDFEAQDEIVRNIIGSIQIK